MLHVDGLLLDPLLHETYGCSSEQALNDCACFLAKANFSVKNLANSPVLDRAEGIIQFNDNAAALI